MDLIPYSRCCDSNSSETKHPSPTSKSPTIETTAEPVPVSVLPAAVLVLSTFPEPITVNSQVIVTVSLINDGEVPILPLRCELLGVFAPVLEPAEGVTYTQNLGNIGSVSPGVTTTVTYLLDAVESGMASLSAGVLIEVDAVDHRQMIVSPVVPLRIYQLTEP